jgi:hypothetical protein
VQQRQAGTTTLLLAAIIRTRPATRAVELGAFTGFFPGFHFQSDSPDDAVTLQLGIVGEKRQSRRFSILMTVAGGFAVCVCVCDAFMSKRTGALCHVEAVFEEE